jgi:hypothetical protein
MSGYNDRDTIANRDTGSRGQWGNRIKTYLCSQNLKNDDDDNDKKNAESVDNQ